MSAIPSSASPTPAAHFAGRKKLIAFKLIAVALPLIGLGLAEVAFRLAGFGGYPGIFRKIGPTDKGELVITDQAGAASWFFANKERPGYNEQYCFYEPKPAGTVRIMLVGESAMKGFPQPRNLASSAFLSEMLKDVWPGKKVEVINLGTTAVASYPVLEIMTEALDFSPDLVVAYVGNNEFFGTYGATSIGWAGSKPWMLKANRQIRSLALVQALDKWLSRPQPAQNKTLMEIMMGRSYTGPADRRRTAAANVLEYCVGEMAARCRKRGVPFLICTLPCNEKDLAPLGADLPAASSPTEEQKKVRTLVAEAEAELKVDQVAATAHLREAVRLWPDHARARYWLGRSLAAKGAEAEALAEYRLARDLDSLPWRPPSTTQQAIWQAARRTGTPVCDLENAFRGASPAGAIGWELMDDHVHPNLRGQEFVARCLVDALTNFHGAIAVNQAALDRRASFEEYARRLGDNPYDRYGVAHNMRVIFDIGFMRETNPGARQRFHAAAEEIAEQCPEEIRSVLKEWQTVVPHAGGKRPITGMVARVKMRQNDFQSARNLYRIAQKAVPDYTSWHMEYVYFALACEEKLHGSLSADQKAEAAEEITHGKVLLSRGFSESGLAERYLGRLHQLRGEFSEAIPFLRASRGRLTGSDLVAADEALVVSYLKTGQVETARKLAQDGFERSGIYASYYAKMLSVIPAPSTNH